MQFTSQADYNQNFSPAPRVRSGWHEPHSARTQAEPQDPGTCPAAITASVILSATALAAIQTIISKDLWFFSIKGHVVIFRNQKSDFRKITRIHEVFRQEFKVFKIEQTIEQKSTTHNVCEWLVILR